MDKYYAIRKIKMIANIPDDEVLISNISEIKTQEYKKFLNMQLPTKLIY